jgi:hypothetical protein
MEEVPLILLLCQEELLAARVVLKVEIMAKMKEEVLAEDMYQIIQLRIFVYRLKKENTQP